MQIIICRKTDRLGFLLNLLHALNLVQTMMFVDLYKLASSFILGHVYTIFYLLRKCT